MNKEIKFRAWYKGEEYMDEPARMIYNIQDCYDGGSEFMGRGSFGSFLHSDDFVVMQFTGLHDKNGKEIYERDICKLYYDYYESNGGQIEGPVDEVNFEWGSFRFGNANIDNYISNEWDEATDKCELEIIGNIFENPELLT